VDLGDEARNVLASVRELQRGSDASLAAAGVMRSGDEVNPPLPST
jgi:hypothetical protein